MRTRTDLPQELGGERKEGLLRLAGRSSRVEEEFEKILERQMSSVFDDQEPWGHRDGGD